MEDKRAYYSAIEEDIASLYETAELLEEIDDDLALLDCNVGAANVESLYGIGCYRISATCNVEDVKEAKVALEKVFELADGEYHASLIDEERYVKFTVTVNVNNR